MTDKEFKHLSRSQLIEIIYRLQLQIDELNEQKQVLEDALADKRLRISNTGNLAEAALEINDCFRSAQNAAEQYLNEIKLMREETESERQKILSQARAEASVIIANATKTQNDYDSAIIPEEDWQIIPNTQEAIVDEDTFERVKELRKHRRRLSATGKTGMFAGLLYFADCGSKLYFAAAKSIKEHQEFYSCSQYRSNRGACKIHYIREVVIKEMVLEAIQKVAKYVTEYEPVFLYLFAKKNTLGRETTIRTMKTKIEKSTQRIKELDMLIERIYEDNVLGKISDDRFYRMSANYEKEQKELLAAVEHDEQKVREAEQEKINLNIFLEAIRECTDLKELTPTLVNTLIKRIDVHNSTKDEHGHKHVPIDIYFTAVGIINIPTEEELIAAMEEMREKPLKSA